MMSRLTFARGEPRARMLWLAQVAFRAKKKAAKKAANKE
jgi:hypothetical protein